MSDKIKRELIERIQDKLAVLFFAHNYEDFEPDKDYPAIFERMTLDQVWSFHKFLERDLKTPIQILDCVTGDHFSFRYAGMYIGIEPDGYLHS